jgi:hypothetical protein
MQAKADHYIGYTATNYNNKGGNLVIELDNGPNDPITITVKDVDTKEPIQGLVLIEATDEKIAFAQIAKGGPQNVREIPVTDKEVEVSDPKYAEQEEEASPEEELPPDPSLERIREGPDEEVEDAGQEEEQPGPSADQ